MFSRHRFRRRPPTVALLGAALIVVGGARLAYLHYFPQGGSESDALLHEGACEIVKVIDGQTLLVRQEEAATVGTEGRKTVTRQVRLIGIETDDPHAAEFVTSLTAEKECRLKFDKRRIDRQQHLLAYVYAGDSLINERLVDEGLARVMEYPGDSASIAKRLRGAESKAKAAKRGLWAADNL